MSGLLPPFPVDDSTLDLLEQALDPWSQGDPEAVSSSLWPFLDMISQMAGSDVHAVAEDVGGVKVMRDPRYSEHCLIKALTAEVRRQRAELRRLGAEGTG